MLHYIMESLPLDVGRNQIVLLIKFGKPERAKPIEPHPEPISPFRVQVVA
jgi:hypothetical protein